MFLVFGFVFVCFGPAGEPALPEYLIDGFASV